MSYSIDDAPASQVASRGIIFSGTVAVVLAFTSALAYLPDGQYRWVLPKLTIMAISMAITAFVSPTGRLPRTLVMLILIGCGIAAIAAALGEAPLSQFFGRAPRYEGIISLSIYVGALWVGARLLGRNAPQRHHVAFLYAVAIGSIVTTVVTVFQRSDVGLLATTSARPGSLLGNATDLGLAGSFFVTMLAPALLTKISRQRHSTKPAIPALVMIFGIVAGLMLVLIAASRAGFLALAISLLTIVILRVVALWRQGCKSRTINVIRFGTVGLVVAAIAVFAYEPARNRLLGESPLSGQTIDDRFDIWSYTANLISQHPWFGVGPSGYVETIPSFFPAAWFQHQDPTMTLDSPHNWILQILAAGGIIGLAIALCTLGFAIFLAIRSWVAYYPRPADPAITAEPSLDQSGTSTDIAADLHTGAIAALGGYIVALLTCFTIAGNVLLLALVCGMLVSQPVVSPPSNSPDSRRQRVARIAMRVTLIAWATFLFISTAADIPLRQALLLADRGDMVAANALFSQAVALRPWDVDIDTYAAMEFGNVAENTNNTVAAQYAVSWGTQALGRVPNLVRAQWAVTQGDEVLGNTYDAIAVLESLTTQSPYNPLFAERLQSLEATQ